MREGYCICGCNKNVSVLGFSFSYLGYFLRRDPRSKMTRKISLRLLKILLNLNWYLDSRMYFNVGVVVLV